MPDLLDRVWRGTTENEKEIERKRERKREGEKEREKKRGRVRMRGEIKRTRDCLVVENQVEVESSDDFHSRKQNVK